MLASVLGGVPYSLTIHGPTEFDMAGSLALDEKIGCAKFTIGISQFGRSQLMRFSRVGDWPRIHVVRCALSEEFRDAATTPVPDCRCGSRASRAWSSRRGTRYWSKRCTNWSGKAMTCNWTW